MRFNAEEFGLSMIVGAGVVPLAILFLWLAYFWGTVEGARQQRCGVYEHANVNGTIGTPQECHVVPSAAAERGGEGR